MSFIAGKLKQSKVLIAYVTSDSKKPGQNAVLYHYCGLSRFFWIRRYIPPPLVYFFENGTKLKIPSDIIPPLKMCYQKNLKEMLENLTIQFAWSIQSQWNNILRISRVKNNNYTLGQNQYQTVKIKRILEFVKRT